MRHSVHKPDTLQDYEMNELHIPVKVYPIYTVPAPAAPSGMNC